MKVDLTNYEVGELTSYYAWCTVEGCSFVTPDFESEDSAVKAVFEHLEEDHGSED